MYSLTNVEANKVAGLTLRVVDWGMHFVIISCDFTDVGPIVKDDDVDPRRGRTYRVKNGKIGFMSKRAATSPSTYELANDVSRNQEIEFIDFS